MGLALPVIWKDYRIYFLGLDARALEGGQLLSVSLRKREWLTNALKNI